jgi:hypothetical protein
MAGWTGIRRLENQGARKHLTVPVWHPDKNALGLCRIFAGVDRFHSRLSAFSRQAIERRFGFRHGPIPPLQLAFTAWVALDLVGGR